MAKITVYIHAAAIMILMGNVNAFCSDGNQQLHTPHTDGHAQASFDVAPSPQGREGKQELKEGKPPRQPIVLWGAVQTVASDTVKCIRTVPQILYNKHGAKRYARDTALFILGAGLPPLSCVFAAIPLVEQLRNPPFHASDASYGEKEEESDSKEKVKLENYPWVPTISAAVTVAIGTLLVKRIFGQKENEEKDSIVSEDIDDEEYNS